MLPPRDPATGRFLPRPSETPQVQAMLERYDAELADVRLPRDDGVTALVYAAVGAVLFLIILVITAVSVANAA